MAFRPVPIALSHQSAEPIARLKREIERFVQRLNDALYKLDHGDLFGLEDDDHEQYHNDGRGDARYWPRTSYLSTSAGAGSAGLPIVLDAGGKVDDTMIDTTSIATVILSDTPPTTSTTKTGSAGLAGAASRVDHRHPNPTPTGLISPWPTVTAPTAWLLCNGSAVSRTTYSLLFAVIGTVFGSGDGSTTFNLPDLRGRVAMGVGSSPAPGGVGATAGATTHTHALTGARAEIVNSVAAGEVYLKRDTATSWSPTHQATLANGTSVAGPFTSATTIQGSTDSANTIPPALGLNWIIYAGA